VSISSVGGGSDRRIGGGSLGGGRERAKMEDVDMDMDMSKD
jgi:hypothetical protein